MRHVTFRFPIHHFLCPSLSLHIFCSSILPRCSVVHSFEGLLIPKQGKQDIDLHEHVPVKDIQQPNSTVQCHHRSFPQELRPIISVKLHTKSV